MAHEVFISYSSRDRAVAEAMCRALEARAVSAWIAHRDITGGADWMASISKAIDRASIFVLLYSENSNTSKHVRREVSQADARDKYIIPFRLTDVALSPSLEYLLSGKHWINAFPSPLDPHLARLVEATLQFLPDRRLGLPQASRPKDKSIKTQKPPRPFEPAAKKNDRVATVVQTRPWPLPKYAALAMSGCICLIVFAFGAVLMGSGGGRAQSSEEEVQKVVNPPSLPNAIIQETSTNCTVLNPLCSVNASDQSYLPGLNRIAGEPEVVTINTLKVDGRYVVHLAGVGAGTTGSVKKLADWIYMEGNTVTCKPAERVLTKYNCNVGTAHDDIAEFIFSKGLASRLIEAEK